MRKKRQRRVSELTGKKIRIVAQVNKNRKKGYENIDIGDIMPVVSNSLGNSKYGEWVIGRFKAPVFVYSHELIYMPVKIVRTRTKPPRKIKRRRLR